MQEINTKLPTNKKFGYFFTIIFFIISIYFYYQENSIFVFLFFISLFFLIAAFFFSKILTPLNKAWFYLGIAIGYVVSPIIIGIIYFVIITPVAVIGKIFGRDELKIKELHKETYWVERDESLEKNQSFKNQF